MEREGGVGDVAAAVRSLRSEAAAIAGVLAAAAKASAEDDPPPPLAEWCARTLGLVLRWLGDVGEARYALHPDSVWLRSGDGPPPPTCAEAAARLPAAVAALSAALRRVRAAPASQRGSSRASAKRPAPHARPRSRPRAKPARQAPAASPAVSGFASASAEMSLLAGNVLRLLVPLRRQHLRNMADTVARRRREPVSVGGSPAPPGLPLPAVWSTPPFGGNGFEQFAEQPQCPLEPIEGSVSASGLRLCLFAQIGTPATSASASEESPQYDDFTVRVHVSMADPQSASRVKGTMRLVVSPHQGCEVTEVRTSLGEPAVPLEEVRRGMVVRMVPSFHKEQRAAFLGTVVGKSAEGVTVAWMPRSEGGPADAPTPTRQTTEPPSWWTGGGVPRAARETWRPAPPEGDGGVTVLLPPVVPGGARDLLLVGRVRCVGLTELMFRVGAAPWEEADKRRLRLAVAAAIQEHPDQLRFAQTGDVAEDGCAMVHAAFPHHPCPRLAQRALMGLVHEPAEDSGLPVALVSARHAWPTAADLRCSLHVRFTDSGTAPSDADSDTGDGASLSDSSVMVRGGARVSFNCARDVSHTVTEGACLAERGGQVSGRVREEIFRQNLCRIIDREPTHQGGEVARILDSPLYDHPFSELKDTPLCRELLWAVLGDEVALSDPQEWAALVRSVRTQSHVVNPKPLDAAPLRRHMLYAPPGAAVSELQPALLTVHSELVRLECEAHAAEMQEPALRAAAVDEPAARSAVADDEAAQRRRLAGQLHLRPGPTSRRSGSMPRPATRSADGQSSSSQQVAAPRPSRERPSTRRRNSSAHRAPSAGRARLERRPSSRRSSTSIDPPQRSARHGQAWLETKPAAPPDAGAAEVPTQSLSPLRMDAIRRRQHPAAQQQPRPRATRAESPRPRVLPRSSPRPDAERPASPPPSPSRRDFVRRRWQELTPAGKAPSPRSAAAPPPQTPPRPRPVWTPSVGGEAKVLSGREAVEAVCAASPSGWRAAMAAGVGRVGTVLSADRHKQTAVLEFRLGGLPTHGTSAVTTWPWRVLEPHSSGPRKSEVLSPACKFLQSPPSARTGSVGRSDTKRSPGRRLSRGADRRRRWARLAALYAAPASVLAVAAGAAV